MIHLWAGPLLSAPAEAPPASLMGRCFGARRQVVVGNDEVSVRPTGVGKVGSSGGSLEEAHDSPGDSQV